MSDFLKIFLVISAVVSAFIFGRGYGERTYRESQEFKDFAKAKDDLNYAKNEFENAKAKLQNIVDAAETKKTDELLAQILQVFLADLGLRIQNQELILKQAQGSAPKNSPPSEPKPVEPIEPVAAPAKAEIPAWTKSSLSRFKSSEWLLENADSDREILRRLEKLELKNQKQAVGEADSSKDVCDNFLGTYRGSVINNDRKRFGSLVFEFRSATIDEKTGYYGTISWNNVENSNSMSEKIGNSCGEKVAGLRGRIFQLTANRFIQVYKLSNLEKLAGNFYEKLPNGTTNRLGAFVLGRTDRF